MASSLLLAWPARFTQRRGRAQRCQPSGPAERLWSVGALGMSVASVPVGSWPVVGGMARPGSVCHALGRAGEGGAGCRSVGMGCGGLRQGCVIYCTLLRAQPGGCAGFRSRLPKAALSSLWLLHI